MRTQVRVILLVLTGLVAQLPTGLAARAQPSEPLPLIEHFAYPGAERILAERGIRLLTGDGHIFLADCASAAPDLVRVFSRQAGEVCFDVQGPLGYLAMELPETYLIRADEHAITATMRSATQTRVVDLRPNEWNPVGEGADPNRPEALLALKARPADGSTPVLPVDTAYPFVGRLDVGRPGEAGARGCTATLVSPWWILSAASCFVPSVETYVNFGGRQAVQIAQVLPRDDRDLALAKLSGPVRDITPARIAGTAPAAGATLTTVGYGRTATVWRPDTVTRGQVSVASSTATTLSGTTTPGSLCQGSAGGAAFDPQGLVSLVLVKAGQSGCLESTDTGTAALASRTDNITAWIADSTRVWEGFTDGRQVWQDTMWFANAKPASGDWNGDGKEDLAILYKWNPTHGVIHTWTATATGYQFNYAVWNPGPGQLVWDNAQFVAGDWNGDGKDDLAILYKWDATHSVIHTWTATGTGFQFNYVVWDSGAGNFLWDNARFVSGDWNGDGKDDLAVLYKWTDSHSVIHSWTATGTGFQFNYVVWDSGRSVFIWANTSLLAGDWGGDGRGDLMVFAAEGDNGVSSRTWTSTGNGFQPSPVSAVRRNFSWASAKFVVGDWNGDGKDEPAAHYRSSDTASEIRAMNPVLWQHNPSTPVQWAWQTTLPFTLDVNSDGRDDLAFFHDNGGDNVSLFTFRSFES